MDKAHVCVTWCQYIAGNGWPTVAIDYIYPRPIKYWTMCFVGPIRICCYTSLIISDFIESLNNDDR